MNLKSNDYQRPNLKEIFTPLKEAVIEIKRRQSDKNLFKKVEDYLNGDVPFHFAQSEPIFYLSRHIATPNYEALRFIELTKPFGLPVVIGQDTKGLFVPHNELKRSLGKLPVTKGVSRNLDEIVEHFTIFDFSEHQGKPFSEISTKFAVKLIEYHNELFRKIYPEEMNIVDEAEWIDRNHRDNLVEQYKKLLSLLIVHGVMLESYPPNEVDFVSNVLKPAFKEVSELFGVNPLIVEHIDSKLEETRNWNGYPSVLYQFIKDDTSGR
jgi:hypothetical protein